MTRVNGGILRTTFWLGAAVICFGVLGTGNVEAAKLPKTDICHFDADTGLYKKLSVSGNAVQKHIDIHGDIFPGDGTLDEDCNVLDTPTLVLARAYIDKNRNDTYDSSEDIVISELKDTDDSEDVSLGDTIVLGQYPLSFDPCPLPSTDCTEIGNFSPTATIEVTSIDLNLNDQIIVSSNLTRYQWQHTSVITDRFEAVDLINSPVERIEIRDRDLFGGDILEVSTIPEPNPSDPVPTITEQNDTDNYFVNVQILPAP